MPPGDSVIARFDCIQLIRSCDWLRASFLGFVTKNCSTGYYPLLQYSPAIVTWYQQFGVFGSKAEILSRIAQCTTTMTRLKPIWNDRNITLGSKVRLMRTLIISILLYACETWTLTIELQRRIKAVEMRCYRRLLHISYKDHITNEIVCTKIQTAIGPYEDLLTTVKKRKLRWYGHVTRSSGLCKQVL